MPAPPPAIVLAASFIAYPAFTPAACSSDLKSVFRVLTAAATPASKVMLTPLDRVAWSAALTAAATPARTPNATCSMATAVCA